jgi:menaquinone-specific isochorismate synthase
MANRRAVLSVLDAALRDSIHLAHDTVLDASFRIASSSTGGAWSKVVLAALSQIRAGLLVKVVVAHRRSVVFKKAPEALDILNALQAERKNNQICYRFALQIESDGAVFFGCSPEVLFNLSSDGSVTIDSIAGTCPRGATKDADDSLAASLLASHKDALENALVASFVVQKARQLAFRGILRFGGTIDAVSLLKLPSVMHLKCTLAARLTPFCRTSLAPRPILDALHPTPAVLGLPQGQAMRFLEMYENFDRGLYAGPFGMVSHEDVTFAVAIRSALLLPKNNTLFAYAGVGLVRGSDAEAEWHEIDNKLKPIKAALNQLQAS